MSFNAHCRICYARFDGTGSLCPDHDDTRCRGCWERIERGTHLCEACQSTHRVWVDGVEVIGEGHGTLVEAVRQGLVPESLVPAPSDPAYLDYLQGLIDRCDRVIEKIRAETCTVQGP